MSLRPFIVVLIAAGASASFAQDAPQTALGTSPLGVRQQRVERMMEELEQKFKSLKLSLQQSEPERAERLQQALNRAKELLIQKRMSDISRLLDEAQLGPAGDGQNAVLTDIRALLALLLDEKGDRDSDREELDLLRQWKQSLENLIRAEHGAQRETDRLATNQPAAADVEAHAKTQDDIAEQAARLHQEMQQSQSKEAAGVALAQQAMQMASSALRQQKPGDASREQGQAIKQLLEALRQIDARMQQLREQSQAEQLALLEAHFREMLATQVRLTAATAALETKRADAGGQLTRTDRNAARVVGDEERRLETVENAAEPKAPGLAGKAQQALDIITADGTSITLPVVVEQVRGDLVAVGNWLADDLRTDQRTDTLQKEIEFTLEALIDALQKTQRPNQQQNGEQSGEPGDSSNKQKRLLPSSAELKLLRSAQLLINRRTAALDQSRPTSGPLDDALKAEIRTTAQRQAAIAETTARFENEILTDVQSQMDKSHRRLIDEDTGDATRQHQDTIVEMLAALIEQVQQSEAASQGTSSGKGSQQGQPGQPQGQAQGQGSQSGNSSGGSRGTDSDAANRLTRSGPQSPWSKLRDKERDPVYSAIKEKFPARYQQLIEQYYKTFQDDNDQVDNEK